MESTKPKPFVFVLMPFADEFEDVYKVGIKPAVQDAGGYCERLDEQIFETSMLERIYNQINKADLIVADMTGRNPNVFYEVGYAHALGKKVILLTKTADDIPFDLKHYPHIVYGDKVSNLKEQLNKRVAWYFEQDSPQETGTETYKELEYYIGGQPVTEGAEIVLPGKDVWLYSGTDEVRIHTSVSIFNPHEVTKYAEFGIGFVFPGHAMLSEHYSENPTRLPDGSLLTEIRRFERTIRPKHWSSSVFAVELSKRRVTADPSVAIAMRFFLPDGIFDTNFTIVFPEGIPESSDGD